ncbi:MAG: membrane dipeptidase [Planctomycetota bacterium]
MTTDTGSPLPWFDAHLDLAYLAELGRDLHAPLAECRGRLRPAGVTLPSMRDAGVRACLATVFTEPLEPGDSSDEPSAYPADDALAAFRAGMRQLKLYRAWLEAGAVLPLGSDGEGVRLGVLIENADVIPEPAELPEWVEGGVVAIGLTWAKRGRYACGNGVPSAGGDTGVTDAGRALLEAMASQGVVLDVSHLNDRSLDGALGAFGGRVVATHSNARSLLGGENERHLTDETIAEIARRGGVIGVNLYGGFLAEGRGATTGDVVEHAQHIARAAGSRAAVGLGSDIDGGFGADKLPAGIRSHADLGLIADGLSAAGWTDAEVRGFAFENWMRFWEGRAS